MNSVPTQHWRWALAGLLTWSLATVAGAQSTATVATAATATNASLKAQRILLVGDSLMKSIALALEGELHKHPGVVTRVCADTWTGLSRLDVYDWPEQIAAHCKQFKPDHALVWLGAADNQPARTLSGPLKPGTPEWATEYARRVGVVMDLLIGSGVRRVFWMDLPDMRDDQAQAAIDHVRTIQRQEAKHRPEVTVVYIRKLLSRTPGKFCPYIVREGGVTMDIRADDGVNLNLNGVKLVVVNVAPLLLE